MNIIKEFIIDKLYSTFYLDVLIKEIWYKIIILWEIGDSAKLPILVFLLLILIILLFPWIMFFILVYILYKKIKPILEKL
ncbi:MAG: hypothetical protein ABIG37_02075 [Nanoarchaeota archaeon]|nr:hypothetical protein [Nanoarchaeota archaeon]